MEEENAWLKYSCDFSLLVFLFGWFCFFLKEERSQEMKTTLSYLLVGNELKFGIPLPQLHISVPLQN